MRVKLFLTMGAFYLIRFTRADENDYDNSELREIANNNTALEVIIDEDSSKYKTENEIYQFEKEAGEPSDLFATNQHYVYPKIYKDLGRRFVLQYPYKDAPNTHLNEDLEAETNLHRTVKDFQDEKSASSPLKPVKAPPELVLAVAKQSALLEASKPINPTEDMIKMDILRSGNYWDDVWQEDVDPIILRSQNNNDNIQTIQVKIVPGSKLYQLVRILKKISPKLIYVINKE